MRAYRDAQLDDPEKAWVSHTELALITVAYSQRFGEMKRKSNKLIKFKRRSDGDKKYSYSLTTCPDYIDWGTFKVTIPEHRIRHAGTAQEKVKVQESLEL